MNTHPASGASIHRPTLAEGIFLGLEHKIWIGFRVVPASVSEGFSSSLGPDSPLTLISRGRKATFCRHDQALSTDLFKGGQRSWSERLRFL